MRAAGPSSRSRPVPVTDQAAGELIPAAALAVLHGEHAPDGSFDQAIPLLTVDPGGFPHVALLSRAQLRDAGTGRDLLAVVWAGRTSAHLRATGLATVILVGGQLAWYLKMSVVGFVSREGRFGVILRLVQCVSDTAGVDLVPMGYRGSPELAVEEGWDADKEVLDVLSQAVAGRPQS
jgi:hypothetical protein